MNADRASVRNRLLRAVPADEYLFLQPLLRPVPLTAGDRLGRPGSEADTILFVESGTLALSCSAVPGRLDLGPIGREGMIGHTAVLGVRSSPYHVLVVCEGEALAIPAADLRELLPKSPELIRILLGYAHALSFQVAQAAFALGELDSEARFARYLLMWHDRTDGDELVATHEALANLLGVHRPAITVAVHNLQAQGALSASRGRLQILSRRKLERLAGRNYGHAEAEYERAIGS